MQRSTSFKLALTALAVLTIASTSLQSELPAGDVIQALSACIGRYDRYHYGAWIQMGDLDKAAARS